MGTAIICFLREGVTERKSDWDTGQSPDMEWAKFRCVGPMPEALQAVNTRIFKEWLPGNPEYEIAMYANIEWYAKGDTSSPDYESAIWIPVKRK